MAMYPIFFYDRTCIKCGSANAIEYIDSRGNVTKDPIYPIVAATCKKCGATYYLQWLKKGTDNARPMCVSKSYVDSMISSMEQYAMEHAHSAKIL